MLNFTFSDFCELSERNAWCVTCGAYGILQLHQLNKNVNRITRTRTEIKK